MHLNIKLGFEFLNMQRFFEFKKMDRFIGVYDFKTWGVVLTFASRGFLKVFEYVGMFVSLCVLINPSGEMTSGEMTSGFANVTGIKSRISKLIYHIRFKVSRNRVFKTKKILNFVWWKKCDL